ncbi:MAG: alpha/beta hydrolase [Candidatus Thorarchaeota archaeon]|nr:MAG: alpha/beta hydrolase [Candidatus Thorarchaeota archaeon]
MTINVETRGDSDAPAIIFIHGSGGSSATWFMQLRGLSDDFHIVAIDLNGHGKSPDRSESNTTDSYLADIKEIVKNYDRPVIGGHSMGGMLAQLFALKHPEMIGGIILVGTGARLRVAQFIFDTLDNNFDEYVEGAGNFMFHESASEELIDSSKREIRKCNPVIIRRDFAACNGFDIMEKVADISLPTLILVGDQDLMTPVKYSEYLHDKIQNSKMHVIDNAGHSVMLEQFEEFNSHIKNWMRSIKTPN